MPPFTVKLVQSILSGSAFTSAALTLVTSTPIPQALNTSTSSSPTRPAAASLMYSARYDTSSVASSSSPTSFSDTNCIEPTWPRKPRSPATTVSSSKVLESLRSLASSPSSSDPPGPPHRSTPVSVTVSACASTRNVLVASPLTVPSGISTPVTFSTTSPSSTFNSAAPEIDTSTSAVSPL